MKEKVMEIMEEYGYSSQRAIARALHQKVDYYSTSGRNIHNTAVFLSQVLREKRPMPSHLADGLVQLCEGDERLHNLLEHNKVAKNKGNVSFHLTQVLDKFYNDFRSYYCGIDDSNKLKLLTDFQSFVTGYTGLEAKVHEIAEQES